MGESFPLAANKKRKLVTVGLIFVMMASAGVVPVILMTKGGVPIWPSPMPFAWLLLLLSFLLTYLYAPADYTLNPGGLVIRRPIGAILIPLSELKKAQVVAKPSLFRVVGSGGLFGYYGIYAEDDGGLRVRVYASRLDRMVRVETAKGVYYLSPAEPERLAEAINHGIPA